MHTSILKLVVVNNDLLHVSANHMFIFREVISYCTPPGRNVPDFGRIFLKLKYTDITQNTYIQS